MYRGATVYPVGLRCRCVAWLGRKVAAGVCGQLDGGGGVQRRGGVTLKSDLSDKSDVSDKMGASRYDVTPKTWTVK